MADGGLVLPPIASKPSYNSPDSALIPLVNNHHNQHLLDTVVNQLPEIADVIYRAQHSRASLHDLLLRTSISDVERLPPIHPSIASSRGERTTRYITFVTAPPIERRPPGKRPKYTPKKPLGEEECYRCQLHTDHSECERHKYIRIGGGFRHSYWYIRNILDIIEEEQRLAAEEAMRKYQEEQERLEAERKRREQPKRRVKTYVRTKSGRKIKKYHYFTEDEYKVFKKADKSAAREMLGLGDGDKLEDWESSRGVYVQATDGSFVKARKRKGVEDSAYEDYGSYEDIDNAKGKHHRRRRYSDSESLESGVGGSIVSGERRHGDRRRHRRHRSRSRDRSYSDDSYDSKDSRGGGRRRRHHRRRRHSDDSSISGRSDYSRGGGSRGGRRRRHSRRRRHRSYSSDDSGTDLGSGDDRRRRRRHRRSRRRSGSGGSSYDSHDDRRDRRRRRRRRHYSDSDSDRSGSVRSRSRRRGGRRRRHRDSSYSDYSDDDRGSGDGRRRRRRRSGGRRRRRRRSYSDDSYSGDSGDRRRRSGRRRRRRRHRDDSYDDEDSYGSGDSRGGERRRRRRNRRRRSYDSYSDDASYSDGEDGEGRSRRKGRRRKDGSRRRRRSYSYSDSYNSDESRSGHRRRRRGRRRHHSDESDYEDDGSRSHSRRRRRKGGRRRRRRHGSSDSYDDSGSDRSRRRRRRRRRHDSSYSDSYSSSSSSAIESFHASDVSEASDPSSVHSSDISSISGDFSESEKRRMKAAKKKKIFEQRKQKKHEEKVEQRKEEVEVKREKKKQEKKAKKEKKKEMRRKREKERRRRYYSSSSSSESRPVSPVRSDDISSVHSSDISSISGDFSEGEKRRRKEEKKKAVKEKKKEVKQKEKEEKRKEERRDRHERRRERRRRRSYISTVSAASSASSVHSSEISDVSGDFSEGEKKRKKEEKKKQRKEEKQKEKQVKKEKTRRDERRRERKERRRNGDDYSSDDSYARGKQDFYDLPDEKKRSMVKYGKGSSRGLSPDWHGDDKRKKKKDKKGKRKPGEEYDDSDDSGAEVEVTTKDGKKVKMKKSVIRQLQREGKIDASGVIKQKIRLKADGQLARDSDSDAESVHLDAATVLKLQSQVKAGGLHLGLDHEWTGFAPTPEPPKTPTDGGRIKLKGVRKVQAAFRKDQGRLQTHLQKLLESAKELKDDENALDERDSSINFISHYRLIEEIKVDPFAKAFVVEDNNEDLILNVSELKSALEGIPSTQDVKDKQIGYALKVLDIDDHSKISFKMFAVVAAVLERVCNMEPYDKTLVDKSDLMDIERKMALYKAMFYCNVNSDRSPNYITAESLRIELIAGGLNRAQEEYIMSKMKPNEYREINFIDYITYIPLFMSMHENIIGNPLDRSYRYTERFEEQQRDRVQLGLPLRREFLPLPKNVFPSGGVSANVKDGAPPKKAFIESGELIGKQTTKLPKIGSRPSSKKSRMFLSLE